EPLDGRAEDRGNAADGTPYEPITRLFGTVHARREQIAIFGHDGVALERGRFGPLRAAEAFAQARLKKAKPALKTQPLARADALPGDAPVRGFAPGPFEGPWEKGFGGLLRAASAAGLSVRPSKGTRGLAVLDFKLLLMGGWKDVADDATLRLKAWYARFGEEP